MTVSVTIRGPDRSAVYSTFFSTLHTLLAAQTGGYFPASSSGEVYTGNWVENMAYAYQQTLNSAYLTDCLNSFNYIKNNWPDANNVLINPFDTTKVYRDQVFRCILYCAISARLLRQAGDETDAASIISSCDTWATAWLTKVNGGTPTTAVTQNGWDNSNATGVPAWAASTLYPAGSRRRPSVANGFVYEAQTNGTSGASAPTFPTTVGATVTDADQVWKNVLSVTAWTANTNYVQGDIVNPAAANGFNYRCIVAGKSGGSAPTFSTTAQATFTDGTVTWRCVATTQQCTFATYTNNGTTYPSIAPAQADLNQVLEEAAMWAVLITDPDSAYSSGSNLTTASGRITACTTLVSAYQVSNGKFPVGDPISPTDGRAMYDTGYADYSIYTMATIQTLTPQYAHADMLMIISRMLDWYDLNYSTEPLGYIHYQNPPNYGIYPGGEYGLRFLAYALLGRPVPLRDLPLRDLILSGAFALPWNNKVGWYSPVGSVRVIPDYHQDCILDSNAFQQALGLFPYTPSFFPQEMPLGA